MPCAAGTAWARDAAEPWTVPGDSVTVGHLGDEGMPIANVTGVVGGETTTCHAGESVEYVFNITNTSSKHVRLGLSTRADDAAQNGWFELTDTVETDLPADGSAQVSVRVRVPEGTAAGRYAFRLRTYLTDDPEQFADSPMIAVVVPGGKEPEPKPEPETSGFRWWPIIAGAAAVLIVGGGLTFYIMRPDPKPPELPALEWEKARWGEAAWQ